MPVTYLQNTLQNVSNYVAWIEDCPSSISSAISLDVSSLQI